MATPEDIFFESCLFGTVYAIFRLFFHPCNNVKGTVPSDGMPWGLVESNLNIGPGFNTSEETALPLFYSIYMPIHINDTWEVMMNYKEKETKNCVVCFSSPTLLFK